MAAASLDAAEVQRRFERIMLAGDSQQARSASVPPRPARPAPAYGGGPQEPRSLGSSLPSDASGSGPSAGVAGASSTNPVSQSRSSSPPESLRGPPPGPPQVNTPPVPAANVAASMPAMPRVLEQSYPAMGQSASAGQFQRRGDIGDAATPFFGRVGAPGEGAPLFGGSAGFDPDPEGGRKQPSSGSMFANFHVALTIFPAVFTLFCLGTFLMPIWVVYHIGEDENVKQWINRNLWAIFLLPSVYAMAHVAHVYRGAPIKLVVIAATIGSCIILLMVADKVLLEAYRVGNLLTAQDCVTSASKKEMETSWQSAAKFYVDCALTKAEEDGITFAKAVVIYRITDCPDYSAAAAEQGYKWSYLEYLEDTYQCAGWCKEGQALWTWSQTKDSCSAAVADVLINKVQWSMMQVVIYVFIVLGFVGVSLIAMGPIVRQNGIKW